MEFREEFKAKPEKLQQKSATHFNIPYDLEGKVVTPQLEYVRSAFDECKIKDPRIKAITIGGSTLKGYTQSPESSVLSVNGNKIDTSDIDIAIFYDDEHEEEKTEEKEVLTIEAFQKIFDQIGQEFESRGIKTFKIDIAKAINVNIENSDLRKKLGEATDNSLHEWCFRSLIPTGIGEIEEIRQMARELISSLSQIDKEKLVAKIMYDLNEYPRELLNRGLIDKNDSRFIYYKMGNVPIVAFRDEERRALVEKRIRKILNIPKVEETA